jgi:hypothetical protein
LLLLIWHFCFVNFYLLFFLIPCSFRQCGLHNHDYKPHEASP